MPWNHWYHCTGSTKGTWMRGDARGWRARHHRDHVDGDYKSPPPAGKYDQLLEKSEKLMSRRKVELTPKQRNIALDAIVASLGRDGAECITFCVGKKHWHGLVRTVPTSDHRIESFLFRHVRSVMGRAKGRSARVLSKLGELPEGGAWAVRCRPIPIKHEQHFLNVSGYIPDHAKKGAAVYCAPNIPVKAMKKPRA